MSSASYTPLQNLAAESPPGPPPPVNITIWDLYANAARTKYGQNIQVLDTPSFTRQLYELQFDICIVSADSQPVEVKKVVVDVSTKEYANHCKKEVDQTVLKVGKANTVWDRSRYHFVITRGVNCGIGGDIGPQVMRLAITGGNTRINITGNMETESLSQNFAFSYANEENVSVPPMSRVKAKIASHSVTFQQGYVVKFMIPSSMSIPVSFRTSFQQSLQNCCCCPLRCFEIGSVSAAQLCCTLPDYRDENGMVSFIQHGVLWWLGEGSTVDKEVESLE